MGEIRIEVDGVPARLVNGRWTSEDKDLARLLRKRAQVALDSREFYPDRDMAIATDAVEAFLGTITEVSPRHKPTDQPLVY